MVAAEGECRRSGTQYGAVEQPRARMKREAETSGNGPDRALSRVAPSLLNITEVDPCPQPLSLLPFCLVPAPQSPLPNRVWDGRHRGGRPLGHTCPAAAVGLASLPSQSPASSYPVAHDHPCPPIAAQRSASSPPLPPFSRRNQSSHGTLSPHLAPRCYCSASTPPGSSSGKGASKGTSPCRC